MYDFLVISLFLLMMALGTGCTKHPSSQSTSPDSVRPANGVTVKNFPTDPMEFRRYLMKTMPQELHATTCQCCNTSLFECFEETLTPGVKACPET